MQAQIDRFSRVVASERVLPDRRSWTLSAAVRFWRLPEEPGLRPAHPAIQYRRGITRTGELDGAKGFDGG
jgi:hypothetical protein